MGKSSSVTVGYKVYMSALLKWCHGPVDKITRFYFNDKIAKETTVTSNTLNEYIKRPKLFGGESSLGGVEGGVDVYFGAPNQTLFNATAKTMNINQADHSANRGVLSTFFRYFYWGNSPQLPQMGIRAQRIHVRDNGEAQWYDEKAAIGESGGTSDFSYSGGQSFPSSIPISVDPTSKKLKLTFNAGNIPDKFQVYAGDKLLLDTGYRGDSSRQSALNSALAARGLPPEPIVGVGAGELEFSKTTVASNLTVKVWAPISSTGWSLSVSYFGSANAALNAVHIIREALTSKIWGMGIDESLLDDAQWKASADAVYADGMGLCLLWDRSKPIYDFINDVCAHIDALPPQLDRRTGKFYLPLIRGDYDKNTLPHFDEFKISKVADYSIPSISDLSNTVTVKYTDLGTRKDASVTVHDPALLVMQGVSKAQTVDLHGFINADVARAAAMRILRGVSKRLRSCVVYTTRHGASVRVGDVIKVTWSELGLNQAVMRVVGAQYGLDKEQEVKLSLIEDVYDFDSYAAEVEPDDEPQPDLYGEPLEPATAQVVFETPYWLLVNRLGDAQAMTQVREYSEQGALSVLFSAPMANSAMAGTVLIDGDEAGTAELGREFELQSGVSKTDTTLYIEAETFDAEAILLNGEIMKVVSFTEPNAGEYEVIVVRGCLDTLPRVHDAADIGLPFGTSSYVSDKLFAASDNVSVKLLPTSAHDVLDEAEAVAMSLTFAGRAARPYPPANVKLVGDNWPTTLSDTVAMTWAHRNRETQANSLIGYYAGGVTKADDLRYGVKFSGGGSTLYQSEVVSGAALSFSFNYSGDLLIEFWAIDNLGRSLETLEWNVSYTGSTDTMTHDEYVPTGTIIDGGDLDD